MKRQTIELHFLSDRFLKWVKVNFTLTPIIMTPIIINRLSKYSGDRP